MSGFDVSVLSDCGFTLGEGPAYDPAGDTAFWFDIVNRTLRSLAFGDERVRTYDLPVMASALARIDGVGDRYAMFTETGLQIFDPADGSLAMHHPIEEDDAATRSNDARVHPSGAWWLGTMGKAAERHAGAVYVYAGGELHTVEPDWTIPNAISFTADGRFGYLAETAEDKLYRIPLDAGTGLPTGPKELFADYSNRTGSPDGAVVDRNDVLHLAVWGGSRIDRIAPDGTFLDPIVVPALQPSCPVFIGSDASAMLVTTAREGLDSDRVKNDPNAGHTLRVTGGFQGRHDPAIAPLS